MNQEQLSQALRTVLREKGWSQSAFANALGISLPTAKRWLKGEGLLLQDWLRALEILNLSPAELLQRAGAEAAGHFSYSEEQEAALAQSPGLLAYFDLLLAGRSPSAIARQHGLAKSETAAFLARLAKVGLIEWLPKDRVRLLARGEPRWDPQGPLARKFRQQTIEEFTKAYGSQPEALRIGLYELSDESLQLLPALYSEVLEKLRLREIHDQHRGARTKKATVILGGAPFTPSMLRLPTRSR